EQSGSSFNEIEQNGNSLNDYLIKKFKGNYSIVNYHNVPNIKVYPSCINSILIRNDLGEFYEINIKNKTIDNMKHINYRRNIEESINKEYKINDLFIIKKMPWQGEIILTK